MKTDKEKINNPLIKKMCDLSASIRANQHFKIRDSEFYEPWDVSNEEVREGYDDFYYLLNNTRGLLESVVEELKKKGVSI